MAEHNAGRIWPNAGARSGTWKPWKSFARPWIWKSARSASKDSTYHLSGTNTVSSLVSFYNGFRIKKNYRHFGYGAWRGASTISAPPGGCGPALCGLAQRRAGTAGPDPCGRGLGQVNAVRKSWTPWKRTSPWPAWPRKTRRYGCPTPTVPWCCPRIPPLCGFWWPYGTRRTGSPHGLNQRLRVSL